ncbi:MAG: M23 family metallopeptidase [Betaproteobacteria bacterium]|nr:MAG: M23 family metallopeptidase [Betaproteobacteria bacterium]
MNIIVVSGAMGRARTLTLDWRHWTLGGLGLLLLFLSFTLLFNYVTLRYAASIKHPLLQAILLDDQREEARKTQEVIQGHLNAMAVRLGELQAQLLQLDGLGERLAQMAGLKPKDLPPSEPGKAPGRGGPAPTLSRDLSVDEFGSLLSELSHAVEERSDQLTVLEALLVSTSINKKFLPSLAPVDGGWLSSSFGWRIDPFSGQKSFHEGLDFPSESGTPIVAAASGKVIFADVHPQYGKMVEVDHGNGLVTRYAHASRLFVKEGDFILRGQKIAAVGSTGRATGPHLHFEVRLNGVPQNPARFLLSAN